MDDQETDTCCFYITNNCFGVGGHKVSVAGCKVFVIKWASGDVKFLL